MTIISDFKNGDIVCLKHDMTKRFVVESNLVMNGRIELSYFNKFSGKAEDAEEAEAGQRHGSSPGRLPGRPFPLCPPLPDPAGELWVADTTASAARSHVHSLIPIFLGAKRRRTTSNIHF